jgi:hypothetical protein
MTVPTTRDDFERLRRRQQALRRLDPERGGGGAPAFLGQVASTTGLAAGQFYPMNPAQPLGSETEGGAGQFTVDTSTTILVDVLGPGTPSKGDILICRFVDHRWVAERSGSGNGGAGATTGVIPNCSCSPIPTTLAMTSYSTTCNFGMFQSSTIVWGAPPSSVASVLPKQCFLSTATFPDVLAGGAVYYYYLECYLNIFTLSRVYPASPYGSPYLDGSLYTWDINNPANTCSPFHLDSGSPYPGSDASCRVTIDQT